MSLSRTRFAFALLVSVLLAAPSFAQARYLWSRSDDGPGHGNDSAGSIALGTEGQIYVAGNSVGLNDSDALVTAYDAYGQVLWEQRLDLGGNEFGVNIAYDADHRALYALGIDATISGTQRCLLWRFDPHSGAIVWQEIYSGPQQQGAWSVTLALDSSGGLLVGGYVGSATQADAIVVRFDSSGAVSWEWSSPTPGNTFGYCRWIVLEPSGDVLVRCSELIPSIGTQQTVHRLTASGMHTWRFVMGVSEFGPIGPYVDADSNLVYAMNIPTSGSHVIAKLDHAGSALWSIDASTLFAANSNIGGLALDTQGDAVVFGSDGSLIRLDPSGTVRWQTSLPAVKWFDQGLPRRVRLARNGDEIVEFSGLTPLDALRYDSIARWDSAGNFLWSQAVREREPGTQVRGYAVALSPEGSIVVAGSSQPSGSATTTDQFVAALHEQSHTSCFGDGSFGACPCNNNSTVGSEAGCKTSPNLLGARLDDQGIASLGSDSLRFFAEGVALGGTAGWLLQGAPAANASPLQDGLACFAGPVLRLCSGTALGMYVDFPPAGFGSLSTRSAALGDPIAPGTSRAYQIYLRGASSSCAAGNGNLTNSVVVEWAP